VNLTSQTDHNGLPITFIYENTRRLNHDYASNSRDQLVDYLDHKLTLAQLVDWAENVMNEGSLDPADASLLRNVISRLGVADVKASGLTWEDCHEFLSSLGYQVEVKAA
jgi:hypothetical protein